jgi:hypothetical protein
MDINLGYNYRAPKKKDSRRGELNNIVFAMLIP